ncbi:uncharacterized protein LOC734443 isoform X1 [Xenopus laevis]|uniref:Uncharacterized protein LOC734443 isoform X1 n=1 Tax=Xenopus laevis TaxID=8355 RepID=A0A8J0UTQ8_XENLA|nr:uncharacterized protein LOC734443 isoform X1 [Xenopus laevis]
MAANVFPKVSVTFRNLSVCFATEDWAILTESDRNMYKDAIQEIYRTLLSMGHRIMNPNILMYTEETENCGATKKRKSNADIPKLHNAVQAPDILLLVEHEKTVGVLPYREKRGAGNMKSMMLSTEEKQDQSSLSHSTCESTNIQETAPALSIFPLPIKKEEEEVYPVFPCPSRRGFTEKDASPASSRVTREEKSTSTHSVKQRASILNKPTKNNVYLQRTLNFVYEIKPSFIYCPQYDQLQDKPFKCNRCCKSYPSNAQLMVHQWNHR